MARYAQFTAESFAARTRPAPPPMPAAGSDYGSLLVVRVGRPKKRPVLMLDPAEAAADAILFQQIAAQDFANPDEAIGRRAVLRLSALAANESGLEDDDQPEAGMVQADQPGFDGDGERALALWSNPVDPVDPSDWNDGAELELEPAIAAPDVEPQAAPEMLPEHAPFVEASSIVVVRQAEPEPWLEEAEPEFEARRSPWRRFADGVRAFLAAF